MSIQLTSRRKTGLVAGSLAAIALLLIMAWSQTSIGALNKHVPTHNLNGPSLANLPVITPRPEPTIDLLNVIKTARGYSTTPYYPLGKIVDRAGPPDLMRFTPASSSGIYHATMVEFYFFDLNRDCYTHAANGCCAITRNLLVSCMEASMDRHYMHDQPGVQEWPGFSP